MKEMEALKFGQAELSNMEASVISKWLLQSYPGMTWISLAIKLVLTIGIIPKVVQFIKLIFVVAKNDAFGYQSQNCHPKLSPIIWNY